MPILELVGKIIQQKEILEIRKYVTLVIGGNFIPFTNRFVYNIYIYNTVFYKFAIFNL